MEHGIDESIVAGSDVLEVEDEGVEARQHLGGRDAGLPVEALHGKARGGIAAVLDLDEVLGVGPDAVLGAEEGGEAEGPGAFQGEGGMLEVGRDRGRVGDEPDPGPPKAARPGQEDLEPRADAPALAAYSTYFRLKRPTASFVLAPSWIVPVTVSPATVPEKWRGDPPDEKHEAQRPLVVDDLAQGELDAQAPGPRREAARQLLPLETQTHLDRLLPGAALLHRSLPPPLDAGGRRPPGSRRG